MFTKFSISFSKAGAPRRGVDVEKFGTPLGADLQTQLQDKVYFCANSHYSLKMLSSERILERAASDGSIDVYGYLVYVGSAQS